MRKRGSYNKSRGSMHPKPLQGLQLLRFLINGYPNIIILKRYTFIDVAITHVGFESS